ncbi:putative quinol monooxygenase [Hymenobacter cheonanensis]|uniref:putative quinol monooxygenase n=1 Tax=Hymenobacter sp. CA2-7 TaxID=3063993 RepID=UPI0027124D78|nr:putative quinol monooxygenase [Hymenobacter sp. CA2-7]MDO7884096.1 putative quinol monooxygenase [Hymenobacter sp. CA2-7]
MSGSRNFRRILLATLGVGLVAWLCYQPAAAQQAGQIVRVARIVVDAAQLPQYKAALKEGMETAVRVEPGVLALNAVYEKENPTHVMVLEVYASAAAYQAHLQTPHFKKYKATTKDMVKSLELVDVEPIALATKAK